MTRMELMTHSKQTALITGASGGIGYHLAQIFAEKGFDLALIARNREKLEQLARELKEKFKTDTYVLSKDLSNPDSPNQIFAEINEKKLEINILVNNAGVGSHGFFHQTDMKHELGMIQLNVVSLTHLTKLFLPAMVQRKSGKILNVASTAAFQPGPLMAVYFATKAYVLSFSEALDEELRGSGVSVSVLCPGPTETDFQQGAGIDTSVKLFRIAVMDSKTVAQAGYEGLMNHKRIIIPGFLNKLTPWSVKLSPRCIVPKVVRFLQESKHKKH